MVIESTGCSTLHLVSQLGIFTLALSRTCYGDLRVLGSSRECIFTLRRVSQSGVFDELRRISGRFSLALATMLKFCTSDDPVSTIVACRPLLTESRSKEALSQIVSWFGECSSHHSRCHSPVCWILPTRVLDVGDANTSPSLCDSNNLTGRWVALSYCWGKVMPLRTKLNNLAQFRQSIPLESMPPLFRDAVTIVRLLGLRYLWIDALCIIQDSEADWLSESAKMIGVFQNATLTIAAEAAKDSSVGLFKSMKKTEGSSRFVIPAHSNHGKVKGQIFEGTNVQPEPGPLSSRAWTLQEQLLSTCILRFAKQQMWWECREARRNEAYPEELHDQVHWYYGQTWHMASMSLWDLDLKTPNPLLANWCDIVNNYHKRQMTFAKDTFPAVAGIAEHFLDCGLHNYRAGLWLQDIHRGLLWCNSEPHSRSRAFYVAPSWSWASVEQGSRSSTHYLEVLTRPLPSNPLEPIAKIERVKVVLHAHHLGQIKAGELIITGPCQEVCRDDILGGFMDYRQTFKNMSESYLETPLDAEEWKLHWSLRKSAPFNIWTIEKFSQSSNVPKPCLLLHVASHIDDDEERKFAYCLILEAVVESEATEQAQDDIGSTAESLPQTRRRELSPAGAEDLAEPSEELESKSGQNGMPVTVGISKPPMQYRRIGLATLQETVPTSTIWPNRTVTII
jgi:hypothetical protein